MAHSSTTAVGDRLARSTETVRLWAAAVLFFVVGDVATTWLGLAVTTVAEVGPLAAPLIGAHGILALLVLKTIVLFGAVAVWRFAPAAYAKSLPLGLAAGGGLVTCWNVSMILLAVV